MGFVFQEVEQVVKTQCQIVNSLIEMLDTLIIGLDFSVDKEKRKTFAVCLRDKELDRVVDTKTSNLDNQSLSCRLLELTKNWEEIILAIDSPMGWPANMSRDLKNHIAGTKLQNEPRESRQNYFRRTTDKFIQRALSQTPLSIGADKIASMAFDALEIMDNINWKFQLDVGYGIESNYKVIEVYPSATIADRLKNKPKISGKKSDYGVRERIFNSIIEVPGSTISKDFLSGFDVLSSDHLFDAFLCLMTGIDYVKEKLYRPIEVNNITNMTMNEEIIRKEGWIWALRKETGYNKNA